jgi:hypothetical protein
MLLQDKEEPTMKKTNRFYRNTRLEKHMPATIQDQTVYLSTGDPELFFNITSLYKPGELGKKFTHTNGKRYQIVQVDAASASTVANGVVYWASRTAYKVTAKNGDATNAAGLNGVAGRCPGITAAGNYMTMQIGGSAILVYAGTTTAGVAGSAVIANNSTLSDTNATTLGTAPTNKVIGWVTVAATATQVTASLVLDDSENN